MFRVWGLGFGVGFGVCAVYNKTGGYKVWGLGFRVWGSGFGVGFGV